MYTDCTNVVSIELWIGHKLASAYQKIYSLLTKIIRRNLTFIFVWGTVDMASPLCTALCSHNTWYQFILVINQLDIQNFVSNTFYFMLIHVSSTMCSSSGGPNCIMRPHHTYRCDDTRSQIIQFEPPNDEHMVLKTCTVRK